MLEQIDLTGWFWGKETPCGDCPKNEDCDCGFQWRSEIPGESTIDWVICGGESGAGHRPMDLAWAIDLRKQCVDAGVPFFFKQVSAFKSGEPAGLPVLDHCQAFPALQKAA